mgnify:CR=1 FL=1
MERKIANIDEFQMDENETPILPAGLRRKNAFTSSPTGVTSPAALQDRGRRFAHL